MTSKDCSTCISVLSFIAIIPLLVLGSLECIGGNGSLSRIFCVSTDPGMFVCLGAKAVPSINNSK